MPVLHGVREVKRLNVYDSFVIADATRPPPPPAPVSLAHSDAYLRLFGKAHLGQQEFCNLAIANHISWDEPARIQHWYARTDVLLESLSERQRASLHRFAASTFVTLIMGDMPQPGWRWPLSDLLDQRPWEPESITKERETPEAMEAFRARFDQRCAEGARPLIVPVRQYIQVEISAFQGQVHRLVQDLDGIAVMIWIHLEGMSVRDCG